MILPDGDTIRIVRKRLIIAGVAVVLLAVAGALVWRVLDLPPPGLIRTYGLPPTGGPTGRTRVVRGIELVEVSAGYVFVDRHERLCGGSHAWERILRPLGILIGRSDGHEYVRCRYWAECPEAFWITRAHQPWLGGRRGRNLPGFRPATDSERDLALCTSALDPSDCYPEVAVDERLGLKKAEWPKPCCFTLGLDDMLFGHLVWEGEEEDVP
jgi:hypothetical protein